MKASVLLHGFTGTPHCWQRVIEKAPEGVVFSPALLGHDGTPGEGGAATFQGEVDRVAGEIAAARLPRARLVGYSLGARVALGLLTRHEDLFLEATLIGVHPGLTSDADRAQRAAGDARWRALLETQGVGPFVDEWEAQPLFASQRKLAPGLLAEQRRFRLSHDAHGLARSLEVLGLAAMPDLALSVTSCRVPVRFVAGARDEKFVRIACDLAGCVPRGRATIVSGAGHNVVLERPSRVAALIEQGAAA